MKNEIVINPPDKKIKENFSSQRHAKTPNLMNYKMCKFGAWDDTYNMCIAESGHSYVDSTKVRDAQIAKMENEGVKKTGEYNIWIEPLY
jgi:hypothetical protein